MQLGLIPTRVEYDRLHKEVHENISKFKGELINSSEILRRYDEILCEKASKT